MAGIAKVPCYSRLAGAVYSRANRALILNRASLLLSASVVDYALYVYKTSLSCSLEPLPLSLSHHHYHHVGQQYARECCTVSHSINSYASLTEQLDLSFREITAITAKSDRPDRLLSKLAVVIQHEYGTKESLSLKVEGQAAVNRTVT